MRKKQKYNPRFFPFSPGIPWKIDRGKYIIPEIDFESWHKILEGREIIITAFGGLIESFFSLCVAEVISSFNTRQIYWLGNPEYSFFIRAQGLCKLSIVNLHPNILKKYPTPLFLDNGGNAYFNILNNYIERISYWGQYPEVLNTPVLEQIAKNIMIPWNNCYIPKLRGLGNDFLDELQKIGRIKQSSKIISIILSDVKQDLLNWTSQNIKEFSQLAYHKGWKVIVFTNKKSIFYGSNILAFDYNQLNILQCIKKSWVVISNDINWQLIALAISDCNIISRPIDNAYSLLKNAEFLESNNGIFIERNLSPIDAFGICEDL